MAKQKATITVDRAKVDEAQRLSGAPTTSATIDAALSELIRAARARRDVAAYAAVPLTEDELALSDHQGPDAGLGDDTDWAALYEDR